MKITYLSNSTIPSRTANSIHVMKMCQAFANLGHEVTLLAPENTNSEALKPGENIYAFYGVEPVFQVIKLPKPRIKRGNLVFGLLAALKAVGLNSDVVYGRNVTGITLASFLRKPVGLEIHQPLTEKSGRIPNGLFSSLMKSERLKALVCISGALKEEMKRKYPAAGEKILTAHDGADPPDETETTAKVIPAKRKGSRLQAGYVGHLYKGKGMELIVVMAERCPEVDFHIVGGTEKDLAYWQAKSSGLDNLHYHGFIPHGKLSRYFQAFDIVLAPYQHRVAPAESTGNISQWMSPLKIFEYMAHGKALICSDLPVLREVLIHGQEALLCPPDDITAWCRAIDNLRKDTDLRTVLGENVRRAFLQHYTWQSRAEKILAFIQRSN